MVKDMDNRIEQQRARLDVPLENIIQDEIDNGFGFGFNDKIAGYIASNPDFYRDGIAEQMVLAIDYLEAHRPEVSESSYDHTDTRVLSVLDQFRSRPLAELEAFLDDPLIQSSKLIQNDHFLTVAPVRYFIGGGSKEGVYRLFQYGINRVENPTEYVNNLCSGFDRDIELLQVLVDNAKDSLSPESVVDIRREIDKLARAIEKENRAREEAERARGEAERAREEARRIAWQDEEKARLRKQAFDKAFTQLTPAIIANPNEYFSEAICTGFILDAPDAEKHVEEVKRRCASTYLRVTAFGNSDPELRAYAVAALSDTLHNLLTTVGRNGRRGKVTQRRDYQYICDHLVLLIPDIESYKTLVQEHPSLGSDSEFYDDWKNSLIDQRLRERALELVDPSIVAELNKADVREFTINMGPMCVKYTSKEELYDDLRRYFVDSEGDMSGAERAQKRHLLDDRSGTTTSLLERFSRSNDTILQEDVINPFDQFIENPSIDNLQPGQLKRFMTEEARCGGTPYKYEVTSFSGCAIAIDVIKQSDDSFEYVLYIQGGGYAAERYSGQKVSQFAAFVDKPVELPAPSEARVRTKTFTQDKLVRDRYEEDSNDRLMGLYKTLKLERIPDIIRYQDEEVYSYWQVPYDGRPNYATARLLQNVVGPNLQFRISKIWSSDEELVCSDPSNLPEPEQGLCTIAKKDSELPTDLRLRIDDAGFDILGNVQPDQAKVLKALEYISLNMPR